MYRCRVGKVEQRSETGSLGRPNFNIGEGEVKYLGTPKGSLGCRVGMR